MNRNERITKANKGFSLVELIIAVAILVIVIGSVCSFIVISSRNYANGNNDISVQQEAQLALNQMSDVIIDATRSINYVGYDSASQPFKALKDAEFAFTPENKALIVYNVETTAGDGTPSPSPTPSLTADGLQNYMFYWQKSTEDLYFAVQGADGNFPFPGDADCVLLAEHVTDFRVDLSEVEAKRVVKLCIVFEVGNKKCEIANNITVRNKVLINDAEIAPLDKSKTISVKAKEPSVILEPGEEFHFSTPKVTGMNITDKSVKWSIVGTVATGTTFKDEANGILQIAGDEKCAEFEVKITTNDKNSDNVQATDTVKVYVKRVTKVELYKSAEDIDPDGDNHPGAYDVVQGSQFTIGGTVVGNQLLKTCTSCGEDASKDMDLTEWKIVSGDNLTMVSFDEKSAVFKLDEEAEVGAQITIRAYSALANRRTSTYGPVWGEITLTVIEDQDRVKPTSGVLNHGGSTWLRDLDQGSTEISYQIVCIRVVDNSGKGENKEEDRLLMYRNAEKDRDIIVEPDLFDLDLNKTYTFVIQTIDPFAIEDKKNREENNAAVVITPDKDVWQEYIDHLSKSKYGGYIGTKFDCSEPVCTLVQKPQVTYTVDGKSYAGENATFPDFQMLMDESTCVIGELTPSGSVNIESNHVKSANMRYSIYKGDGDNPSEWEKLYWFDGKSMSYQGASQWYDTLSVNPGGNPFMQMELLSNRKTLEVCGKYHIVPGLVFQRKVEHNFTPIGYKGFDFYGQESEQKYYELTESTMHITITADTMMDVTSAQFTGGVAFPLPGALKTDWRFPNLTSTDWQETTVQYGMSFRAMNKTTGAIEEFKVDKIRYHYIPAENKYEVELLKETQRDGGLVVTYSYGKFKCAENGTKWEQNGGTGTDYSNNKTIVFEENGTRYIAYYPLPTDPSFPFEKTTERQKQEWVSIYGYEAENWSDTSSDKYELKLHNILCDYDKLTESYILWLIKEDGYLWSEGVETYRPFAKCTWKQGETDWEFAEISDVTMKEKSDGTWEWTEVYG